MTEPTPEQERDQRRSKRLTVLAAALATSVAVVIQVDRSKLDESIWLMCSAIALLAAIPVLASAFIEVINETQTDVRTHVRMRGIVGLSLFAGGFSLFVGSLGWLPLAIFAAAMLACYVADYRAD